MANVALNIVVGGEEKAKQAIKELNGNLKQLGTNMKSLDEVFAGNQNSYDYLSAKLKNLTEAQDAYRKKTETLPDVIEFLREQQNKLADNTDDLKQKMEQATAAYDNAENKTAALKRAMNEATKEFNDNQKALNYARDAANDYQRQLTEAEGKVDVLGEEIRNTNGYLREVAVSADGTATSIDRYGKEVKDAGEDTKSFGEAANVLAQAIVASGAVQGAEKLRDAIVDTAKASIEYESAFAGVRKTVDGTAEELDAISGGLRSMSLEIPMAVEGLAGIAENAGQLGIAKDSILDFTETIAALSVTTNLSADEAATSLAKFANVTNMSEKNYSNLGSSIVALGNNFATTEADIVAMATRLAATGEIVGLTEPQILAVATALSSVGIEAEAGGSAFSKLLRYVETSVQLYDNASEAISKTGESVRELELMSANNSKGFKALSDSIGLTSTELKDYVGVVKDVDRYASVAGVSVEEFMSAWSRDSVSTFSQFIEGLGKMESQGKSVTVVLDEMGLTEVRLNNAIQALATSEGLLSDALELSSTAWAENTALADEAAVRYETTESKLQLLKNAFNDLKITVGDELKESFGGAIEGLTDLTAAANEYVKQNPEVVSGIMAVAAALGSFAVVGTVIPLVSTLWGLLSANPAGLAAAGIIALVSAVAAFAATLPEANDDVSVLIRDLEKLSEQTEKTRSEIIGLKEAHDEQAAAITAESGEIEKAIAKVEELGNKSDITASESEILKSSIDKLNKSIPGLRLSYDDLNDSLEETVYHLRLVASAQALVDEAVTKSDLKDSLKAQGEELQNNVDSAKKALDDAQELLDAKKLLEEEFFETQSGQKNTEEALKPGETPWSPYAKDIELLEQALKDANDAYTVAVGAREANKRSIYELTAEISKLDEEYADKAKEIKEINSDLFKSTEEAANGAAQAVDTTEQAMSDTAETAAKAAEKVKATTDTTKKAVDEAADALKKNTTDVKTALDSLTKEYNSTLNSTKSALGGIGGLFGEVAFTTEKSIDDMIRGLETQADYMTGYMQNIQRAAQIGLDEGLIAALSDGSNESAGYIQKIINEFGKLEAEYGANSTEAEGFVERFNNAFRGSSEAQDALAHTLTGITTDFDRRKEEVLTSAKDLVTQLEGYTGDSYGELAEAVAAVMTDVTSTLGSIKTAVEQNKPEVVGEFASMRGDIEKEFDGIEESGEVVGENFTDGVAKGVEDGTVKVEKAVETMAKNMVQTVNNELQIRSPSKVGAQQGKYYDEGIAEGIEDGTPTVVKAAKEMVNDLESATEKVAAAAGTSLGQTIAENLSKSMLDGLHEAIAKGQAYVTGANGEKIPILPSSAIDVPEDFDREAWLESMYAEGWNRGLSGQDIVNLLNAGVLKPPDAETLRQMGYDVVADAMEAAEEGAERYWSGASLLEKQNENVRTTAEKALENLLGLDLKENVGEEKRKEAYEAMFGAAEMTYDEAIQALNDAYMQAVKDFRASGQGFSAATLYEAVLDSDAYAELSEKAGQNMADETVSGWTNEITTMSVQSEKAVGEMLEETEKANMEAAASVGSALGSALVNAFVSAASRISSVGVDGIKSTAGSGATINLTQNFNTPTATPYQTKVASESGIKAVLY